MVLQVASMADGSGGRRNGDVEVEGLARDFAATFEKEKMVVRECVLQGAPTTRVVAEMVPATVKFAGLKLETSEIHLDLSDFERKENLLCVIHVIALKFFTSTIYRRKHTHQYSFRHLAEGHRRGTIALVAFLPVNTQSS